MATPAIIQDVQERFERPLTPAETTAATKWLDDAWSVVRRTVPAVETRMTLSVGDPGRLDPDDVTRVVCWMVIRVLRNPDALRQWSDDTYNQTVDTALSSGLLYMTDQDKAELAPYTPGLPVNGMYSIPLGR